MPGISHQSSIRLPSVTANPSGPGDGDMWYRSDLGQTWRYADGNSIPEAPTQPFLISSRWYPVGIAPRHTTGALTLDRCYAIPFWPGRKITINGLCVEVTSAGAASNVLRAGLRADDGSGSPGTLLNDFGTVSSTTNGVKSSWSGGAISVALDPVLYWFLITSQVGTACSARKSDSSSPFVGEIASTPSSLQTQSAYYDDGITGAYSGSFVIAGGDTGPVVKVKIA